MYGSGMRKPRVRERTGEVHIRIETSRIAVVADTLEIARNLAEETGVAGFSWLAGLAKMLECSKLVRTEII